MRNLLLNKLVHILTKGILCLWLIFPLTSRGQTEAVFSFDDYYGYISNVHSYDGGYLIAPQSIYGDNVRHILKINQLGGIQWKIEPSSDDELRIFQIAIVIINLIVIRQ